MKRKDKELQKEHYIDNKVFYDAMVEYKKAVKKAEADKQTPPRVPEYIGDCFIKIANHLAFKYNFINYTYRDEMIADGILCMNSCTLRSPLNVVFKWMPPSSNSPQSSKQLHSTTLLWYCRSMDQRYTL